MYVRTILDEKGRNVVTGGPQLTVRQAAVYLHENHIGAIVIVDRNDRISGILTERDLMTRVLAKALNPQATQTSEVMTPNPHCVEPHMKVSEAVLIMIERGFRHLPIVTSANKILGVFSVRDALPREIGDAVSLAEFNDQVNDALG